MLGLEYSSSDEEEQKEVSKQRLATKKRKLPSPFEVNEEVSEKPNSKKRTFPHVDGNWAGLVYIKVNLENVELCKEILKATMEKLNDHFDFELDENLLLESKIGDKDKTPLHISLSKTFVLQYHNIHPFIDLLKSKIFKMKRFEISLSGSEVFINDDKSRSFVGLMVLEGIDLVFNLIDAVDSTMKAFHLPKYYENSRPHLTFASGVGNVIPLIPDEFQTSDSLLYIEGPVINEKVYHIEVKIGNTFHKIPLN